MKAGAQALSLMAGVEMEMRAGVLARRRKRIELVLLVRRHI